MSRESRDAREVVNRTPDAVSSQREIVDLSILVDGSRETKGEPACNNFLVVFPIVYLDKSLPIPGIRAG